MTNRTNSPLLCIGDEILFYDESNNLLLAENPLETRACTRPTQNNKATSESLGASIFKIEPQQSHAERRHLEDFLCDDDSESVRCEGTPEELMELDRLTQLADKEHSQNQTERQRLLGKPVLYGQVIQLYNSHFNKYLGITGRTCENDVSNLQVNLSNEVIGSFRIMPRYRIRVDGEPVRLGDTIAIQCVRPEGYLNVGLIPSHSSIYDTDYYEVYSHTRISSWTMCIHSSATAGGDQDKRKAKYINSAQYIRFYHKEMEAYLESNVLNWDKNEVRLKRHVLNPLDPKESDSPLSFWEIENADMSRGSLIRWKKSVRIRHAASRAYLYIDPNNVRIDVNSHKVAFSLGLMKDPPLVTNDANDPTLFAFVPASEQDSSGVPFGSYLRIQHVATRCWLHASSKSETQLPTPPSVNSMTLSLPPDSLLPTNMTPGFLDTSFAPTLSLDRNQKQQPIHHHHHHHNSNSNQPQFHHRQRQESVRFSSTDSYGGAGSALEVPTTHQVTATQDFFYHDCFTVTLVSDHLTSSFNIINEFLPRLQAFLKNKRVPVSGDSSVFPIVQHEFASVSNILMNLIKFCTKSSEHDLTKRRGLPIPYHQALLRDNGIIEAVIHMIQIPFNLAKRGKFNRNKKSDQSPGGGYTYDEKVVDLDALTESTGDQQPEYRLKVILTLCYNLLRVFLLGASSFEENSDLKVNQNYVIDTSGDAGIQLYLSHLNCGIGATPMLENLIQDNDKMVNKIVEGRPDIVEILVKHVYNQSRSVLRYIHGCNNINKNRKRQGVAATVTNVNSSNGANGLYDVSPSMVEHMEFVGCLDLLGAFCSNDSASGSLTFSHRDYVLEQLFDPLLESHLIQCRLVPGSGSVEISILSTTSNVGVGDDTNGDPQDGWMDLDMLLYQHHVCITRFLSSLLDLVCSLSHGTSNSKSLEVIRGCISEEVCLKCIGFVNLPSEIRGKFCDLLRVLYVDIAPYSEVLLSDFTIRYDSLEGSSTYPRGGNGDTDTQHPDFFDQLKRWTLVFLDDHRHCFTECTGDINFLSSVLKLIYTQLKLGFFSEEEDVKRLFRALVYVLDGRIDARNAEHRKYLEDNYEPRSWHERFLLTESNQAVMNIKIQVLEIFDLIFDLRVHVRMNKLATRWKRMETNLEIDPFLSLRNILTTIFSETVLRQRESSLMPILKDILKYQYAPLKHVAVVVMHRMYHDCEDLFKKSDQVLILHEPQQVFVYHGIKKRLSRLRSYLLAEKLGADHLPLVDRILREFISLFHGNTIDYNDQIINIAEEDPTTTTSSIEEATQRTVNKRIFKNLNTHQVIIHILDALNNILPIFNDSTSESFSVTLVKTCLDLLVDLVKDDASLQGSFVLDNFDLLIDVTSYHAALSYALYGICGHNLYISIRVSEEQIKRILELSGGQEANYLRLLHDFMKPHGKLIKRNQDMIMRLIMNNKQLYIPFATIEELVHTDSLDYCLELIELLSICGHGENTFGQSFARTVFSISDITDMVQNTDTPLPLKSKALRFLASIYLDTGDTPSTMIPIDDNNSLKALMDILYQDLVDAGNVKADEDDDFTRYIYEGVIVFMRSIFEHQVRPETILDENLLDLCPRLIDATSALLMISNGPSSSLRPHHHQKSLLACLDSMLNVSGFHGTTSPNTLRGQIRQVMMHMNNDNDNVTNQPLGSINAKFQGFIRTLKAHRSVLELQDEEFKQLGSHYNLSDEESESDVKSLIDFLSMMTSNNKAYNDKNEDYQVATMKLLQEIPNRYIRQRSEEDSVNNATHVEDLELSKINAQNILNRLGCTLVAQNFLSSPKRHVFKAGLTLLIALLEGGNKNVQDKLEEYFYSIREERFFYSFHRRMQTDISSLKEAQQHLLRAAVKLKRQEGLLQSHETKSPWMVKQRQRQSRQNRRTSSIITSGPSPIRQDGIKGRRGIESPASSPFRITGYSQKATKITPATLGDPSEMAVNYQTISTLMAQSEMAEFGTAAEDFEGMKDAMRAVQLMVEGHNMKLQTYLAKQPDNIKSFNIVQDVVEYLHAIVPLCNIQNIRLIIQVLDTITELAQGCLENQFTIFNGKIINPMNTVLREAYVNCPSSLVHELKSKVVVCLLSLLEGGIENSDTIFREMTASLNLQTIVGNMETIYTMNRSYLDSPNAFTRLEGGFLYCMLIMTLYPALDDAQRAIVDGNEAFDYFQRNTGKIEVIMDYGQEKQLSRVLFPIPEICKYFREETKQRFLWNVKRDSPSTKIEDFVEQSGHMIYEIENQARVTYNEHLSLLTKYSSVWWKASFVVTILLNALMLSCSSMLHGTGDPTSSCHSMNTLFRISLGLGHLILWHLSTAEFYFIQLPILVKRRSTTKLSLKGKMKDEEQPSVFGSFFSEEHFKGTFLLASLMESQFIYHVVMVLLSYLGLWYPGFYAVHLLDFVFRDRILQGVIASITLNGSSISHTAMLAIVVIYLHSVMAYKYFRGDFDTSKGLYCRTLSECFVNVLSHGLRGGIGDVFTDSSSEDGLEDINKRWRIGFEMSFYLVVVVFLLNAIFGIIFDTFGHLRDERSAVQQDMKNSCFICSVPAVEFQRHAKRGFEDHVKNDHNIWQYLFFLVHLKYKDKTEYTGPESYVAGCLKDANYGFFPINRALCLHQSESNDTERLEKLEDMTHTLMDKLNKLEEQMDKLSESQSRSRSNSVLLSPY